MQTDIPEATSVRHVPSFNVAPTPPAPAAPVATGYATKATKSSTVTGQAQNHSVRRLWIAMLSIVCCIFLAVVAIIAVILSRSRGGSKGVIDRSTAGERGMEEPVVTPTFAPMMPLQTESPTLTITVEPTRGPTLSPTRSSTSAPTPIPTARPYASICTINSR